MGSKKQIARPKQRKLYPATEARRWLEVAIRVDGPRAEAATGVLFELGCRGVISAVTEFDSSKATKSDRLRGFFPAQDETKLRERIARALARAGLAELLGNIEYSHAEERDWASQWQQHFAPIRIGRRLVILPPWRSAPENKVAVVIEPGMGFGTGSHETTRACLVFLDKLLAERSVRRALDVGTGSGILAIAMAKLGVSRVVALDSDRTALASARKNIKLNRVGKRVILSNETLPALRGSLRPQPLVAANLYAEVLAGLESDLSRVVEPGGRLVASGILANKEESFLQAFEPSRWQPLERRRREGWVTCVLERRAAP